MLRKRSILFLIVTSTNLFSPLMASAATTPQPLAGTFSGNATEASAYSGNISQVVSPDSGELSLVFDKFGIEAQSGSQRKRTAHLVLSTPVNPVFASRVTADLRGGVTVAAGTKCAVTMGTGLRQVTVGANRSKQVFIRTQINVVPGDSEITIAISLHCEGAPENASYVAQIDSLDLAWSRKPKK